MRRKKIPQKITDTVVESEIKFRTIAEQSPNMIFINAGGRVVYANKQCEAITGYKLKEFYSPKFSHLTLTAPEYRELVKQNFMKHARGEEVEPYEYALITKNGRKLNTILSTKLIDYKGRKAILGTITDITEKKKAEEALLESEKKYRTLFEQNDDAIALLEVVRNKKGEITDRKILEANPAFIKLTSATGLGKLKGKTIAQIFGKKLATSTLPQVRVAMAKGISQSLETHLDLNGRIYDYANIIIPISKNQFLTRTIDITALRDLDRKKDEFIGVASHELKTPLTSLLLFSQILQKKKAVPKHILPKMHKQIEKLNTLVNELLDVTRVHSNTLRLYKVRFSIVNVIRNCVENILFITPNHKINFTYDEDLKIFGDKGRIEQVIINLLTNAVKYSPQADKIHVTLKTSGDYVRVGIKDQGIGIEKKVSEKIFERFYRAKGDGKFEIPGFGMGLYISKEIVQQHGGKIWVKSKVGHGSTFYFSLPLK